MVYVYIPDMGGARKMRVFIGALGLLIIIFSGCRSHHKVYSNSSFHRAYKQDARWDYRGYDPESFQENYNRYNPDREDHLLEELNSRREENQQKIKN